MSILNLKLGIPLIIWGASVILGFFQLKTRKNHLNRLNSLDTFLMATIVTLIFLLQSLIIPEILAFVFREFALFFGLLSVVLLIIALVLKAYQTFQLASLIDVGMFTAFWGVVVLFISQNYISVFTLIVPIFAVVIGIVLIICGKKAESY